jgi:outer membrane protein, heavy metal efflux system
MKAYFYTLFLFIIFQSGGVAQPLDEYFKIAAENNPGLRASYREFEAAMEKIPQVSSLPDPTFSFGYFISPVETRVGPQRARFSLNQMFPWFGTLKARGDAAALQAEARYQAFLNSRNQLYFQVASAWYPLYELNRWKQVEQDNINILQSYKNIATRKFENGNGPMVDVLRVDIMLQEAQTNLKILNEKERSLVSTFNNLLNRHEYEKVEIADSLNVEFMNILPGKDSMLIRNPLLNQLEIQARANEINREVARRQGLPNLGIGLDYVIVGEPSGMSSPDNGKDVLMPMVSVSIPLFRGKYRAAERVAQLMQESFTLQKENMSNSLSSEYDRTLFQMQQQQQLIALYDGQITTSRQSLNLLFRAYSNTGTAFEEVLRMQQQLLQYEKRKATALMEFNISRAKINYLTVNSIQQ